MTGRPDSLTMLASVHTKTANVIDVYRKMIFEPAVVRNNKPVVVFYYSSSQCKPCSWSILPILEKMVRRKSESIYLAKVDLDKVPEFRTEHAIETLPTVMTYFKGDVMDYVEGLNWGPIVKLVNEAARMK
ncbi:thioredoxin-like protein slr0233 isoform X2 [Folsomia candida]|uniref:thioredoxin-like protein slr0233 isoform X2 n=1 Tax=Folsomia candida TaxID=158441 RepID=UPI000B906344|nr:thioredoxin-like protein slr0233 isoform X2 [Folsomia candida]